METRRRLLSRTAIPPVLVTLMLGTSKAAADPIYHLTDVSPGGPAFKYTVSGMNASGIIAGQYLIVTDQPAPRGFVTSCGQGRADVDVIFNGKFGVGPTGENIYGVDKAGNVFGNVHDAEGLQADFVAPPPWFSATTAPLGTYAGMAFDNGESVAPPDISLIDNGAGWTLLTAVSNDGQIAGVGIFNGLEHVYLLQPVPEPSSLLLLVIGGFSVICLSRPRQVSANGTTLRQQSQKAIY